MINDGEELDHRKGPLLAGVTGVTIGAILLALAFARRKRAQANNTDKRGAAQQQQPMPARPRVRLDVNGLTLNGQPATTAQALAACRASGACDVTASSNAHQDTWRNLLDALSSAGVEYRICDATISATIAFEARSADER